MKVLVTCPPMLHEIDQFRQIFLDRGLELTVPDVVQTLSESQLIDLVPAHDGWIIGDDPATRRVLEHSKAGNLRAAVKWGIGMDNIDVGACQDLEILFSNTPNMFGPEVADLALGYVIALARQTFDIDRAVRLGEWPKLQGVSLEGKIAGIIGFGDIGHHLAPRLQAIGMEVVAYDPMVSPQNAPDGVGIKVWPGGLAELDFVIVTCALTDSSRHIIDDCALAAMKPGVRIVNVSRGGVIHEEALTAALQRSHVFSAALDVFECEPLPMDSSLRRHPSCIFGSHNASNTKEAVTRTSQIAIEKLLGFLGVSV